MGERKWLVRGNKGYEGGGKGKRGGGEGIGYEIDIIKKRRGIRYGIWREGICGSAWWRGKGRCMGGGNIEWGSREGRELEDGEEGRQDRGETGGIFGGGGDIRGGGSGGENHL